MNTDNIKVLQIIDQDNAQYYLDSALRYFSNQLVAGAPSIGVVQEYIDPLKHIANEYLAWDNREVKRKIESMDTWQRALVRAQLPTPTATDVDQAWRQIEDELDKENEEDGL